METALKGARILLGVSSSISAYKALDLASKLRKGGAEVRAVLTENAARIATPAAFDAITHQRTITSLWESAHAGEMDHLAATKWASLFVLAPATANLLGQVAQGLGPDALATLVLAWNKRPLLIAPAMNPEMWRNAAVQANVATLRARGHRIIDPEVGRMACDDVGPGRLASVENLYNAVVMELAGMNLLRARRVLITAGPTREFADDVRCITNPSTGRMGIALAREAWARGAEVTLILGDTELAPPDVATTRRVTSAEQMREAVLEELSAADICIFAAAVSDWKPAQRIAGKEKKTDASDQMDLRLVRTPDIAAAANDARRPGQIFVGFAAESKDLEVYAQDKMRRKGFDLIFANPINEAGAGFGAATNRGLLLRKDGHRQDVSTAQKEQIAALILTEAAALLPPA